MGLISPSTIEQIRTASDIVEVITAYLPLKRAGANFVALCPFHREKSPSFHVNPQRQVFHCFGCHKGGDVFTFVREYENLPFMDAVRRLAERAHIVLEYDDQPGQRESRQIKDVLLEMHEKITQRWQQALTQDAGGQIARDYLAKRQVPAEAVQLFRIGYAPELWDDTVNWARGKGYDMALVEQAGLVVRKEGSDHCYDRFRGRLMFPICDDQGRVIAFSGRVLAGDEKTAKYVNSPETPIFSKSRVFYGLDKSKRPILDAGQAVICEGQLDLIACYMAGVRQVVASQGTAFTGDHARILKRYTNEVVLCYDGDKAGQDAAVRVVDLLLPAGMAVRVARIPSPHDPDSYVKEFGAAAFQALVQQAEGYFDFLLHRLFSVHDPATDKGRMAIVRELAAALKRTGSQMLLDTYAQKAALRLGVAPEAMVREFRQAPAPRENQAMAEEGVEVAQESRPSAVELRLLQLVLSHDELAPGLLAKLNLSWVLNDLVRRALALRGAAEHSGNWQGLGVFLTEIEENQLRNVITEALTNPGPMQTPELEALDALRLLRNQYLTREIQTRRARLGQPGLAETETATLVREIEALSFVKRQPLEAG